MLSLLCTFESIHVKELSLCDLFCYNFCHWKHTHEPPKFGNKATTMPQSSTSFYNPPEFFPFDIYNYFVSSFFRCQYSFKTDSGQVHVPISRHKHKISILGINIWIKQFKMWQNTSSKSLFWCGEQVDIVSYKIWDNQPSFHCDFFWWFVMNGFDHHGVPW